MPGYNYEAFDASGKVRKGVIEADSEEKALAKLKSDGMITTSIAEQNILTKDITIDIGGKPKARDFSVFCRQFVSMTQAGVTLLDTLTMLAEQTENKRFAAALNAIRICVEKGESLTTAMRQEPLMPSLLVSMVEAGEASGSLDTAMDRMATHFEKNSHLTALVKKALIYPIVLLVVAIGVVIAMLVKVIPTFDDMFAEMDMELPAITKAVVKASDFMVHHYIAVIIIMAGIVVGLRVFKSTKVGEYLFAKIGLKIPVFGALTIKQSSAQFARTASTLLGAGLSLVDTLEICSNIMGNRLLKDALSECRDEIMQGAPLSQPLQRTGMFPPMVYHMAKIGEESGDLEGMLSKLADYYEEEVEMTTQSLTAAMEPMIIIVLAGIVGILVGAVVAPLASMYTGLDNL